MKAKPRSSSCAIYRARSKRSIDEHIKFPRICRRAICFKYALAVMDLFPFEMQGSLVCAAPVVTKMYWSTFASDIFRADVDGANRDVVYVNRGSGNNSFALSVQAE